MKRILIIEDDPAILQGLTITLQEELYEVQTARDGQIGFETAREQAFDLILLDLMLPGKNGRDVCRELRQAGINTPIIMLTSKKEEADKVLGLELGADDYVTKPFSLHELLARIKAVLRRAQPEELRKELLQIGQVTINFKKMTAIKNGQPLKLTAREFELLRFLVLHEGKVVTRDMLLDAVWGYHSYPTTRTVDTFILNLRKKIEENPAKPKHIQTVHTLGYRLTLNG